VSKGVPDNQSDSNLWLGEEGCSPADVAQLIRELTEWSHKRNLSVTPLGRVGEDAILLLLPRDVFDTPNILIAAGFHGEEPAGCWSILRFLKTAPEELVRRANVSFLPLVNPTGMRVGRRYNDWEENPNRGFCPSSADQLQPSREGQILIESLARDGFLSLHEDVDQQGFYLFVYGEGKTPGPLARTLHQTESRFFAPCPDGPIEDDFVCGGIAEARCDGTFEDYLFHQGVPRTACTETPGALAADRRVAANVALITAFVGYVIGMGVGSRK
jgi:hypothetical protein